MVTKLASSMPRVGSALIVVDDGKVLLGKRGKDPNRGRWVLPGGKVEPFEPLEAAARREGKEETGLEVEIIRRLGVYEIISEPSEHRIIVYNVARVVGGALRAGSDLEEVQFFSPDELCRLDLSDVVRKALTDAGWLGKESSQALGLTA